MHHTRPLSSARIEPCAPILAALRDGAWLAPESWATPQALQAGLRQVAARDLSAGRLLEGHVRAHRLIRAHGTPAQLAQARAAMSDGLLYAVWSEDGARPTVWNGETLAGDKRGCAGLGLARRAIVTARRPEPAGDGPEDLDDGARQLLIVEVGDPRRHRPEDWDVAGLAECRAGGFECTGLVGAPLGPPDAFAADPHDLAGAWRIAATALGGVVGLLDRTRAALTRRGRLASAAELSRLAPLAIRALAADAAVARAGELADGPGGRAEPERAATLSISTRLLTEALGQDAIAAAERSVGLEMFAQDHPVGRMARDLACYLRQPDPDAMTLRAGRGLLVEGPGLESWFDA